MLEMSNPVQIREAAAVFEEAQSRLNYDDYDSAVMLLQRAVTLDPSVSFMEPLEFLCPATQSLSNVREISHNCKEA